jgi:ATP-dependent helicase/nuclease subunit A
MPTRTGLPTLERALDSAGIPYRVESQSMLLGTQDVRELLSCLRAIDSPSDAIALVAALRSSAFAISDVELLEFIENGGHLDYTDPGTAGGPVKEALESLCGYHKNHAWVSPAELIERFIRDRCMEEVCFGRSRPRERIRRLRFVIEKARAFSELEESSLRGFLDWMERLANENARMIEVPVPEADEDAVRIMTVHAAKGLEFPVTILMGAGFDRRSTGNPVIFDCRNNTAEVSIGPENGARFLTAGYGEANERGKTAEEAEQIRLMYVAATRAKDHLVVSLYRKTTRNDHTFAARLEAVCEKKPGIWNAIEFLPAAERPSAVVNNTEEEPLDTQEDRERWIKEREALVKRSSRPDTLPATAIAHVNKEETEEDVPYRRGRGGTNLGRAVHSVLQTIDLATGKNLQEIAQAQAAAEGIPDRTGDIVRLIRKALETAAVGRAVSSGHYYREVFVSAPAGERSIEGFIDLLFEEEGGFVIVDYKTDAIDEEPSESKKEQYSLQAGVYALALSRVTKKPVKEVILLFLNGPKELSFTDTGRLIDDAEKAVDKAFDK